MRKQASALNVTFSIFLIAFTLQSCTHYYYGPNSSNIPLLQKKDDGRISAAIAGADETTGFELQSAYAFSNHIGGMLNFYTTVGKEETSSNSFSSPSTKQVEKGNGTFIELGVGYFTPINTPKWIFETYTGLGTGTINNTYTNNETSQVGLTKLFIQPSIGYSSAKGTFHVALSSRFSHVHLGVKMSTLTAINNSDLQQIMYVKDEANRIYWEPALTTGVGIKSVKLQLQLTTSGALTQKSYPSQDAVLAFGVVFSFNGQAKK
jgi:hypothetical protein